MANAVGDILKTEYSEPFDEGRRQRMAVSFYKYGPLSDGYPHKVDAIGSLMQRLRLYASGDPAKDITPGNTEYLMDAANFAMIEFMHPRHPEAHFTPTDDDGSPGRISLLTGRADKKDNRDVGLGDNMSPLAAFRRG